MLVGRDGGGHPPTISTPTLLPTGSLYSPQFPSLQETKMADRRSSENFPLLSVFLCCLVSRWVSLAGGLKGLRNSRDLPLASAHLRYGYRCKLESSTINLNYRPCRAQMEIKGQFDAVWVQYLQREPAARKRNDFSRQRWQIKKPKWCQGWRQVGYGGNNVEIVNSNLLWKLEIIMSYKVGELITAG